MSKRIVLLYTTGPHAGLHSILGHTDDLSNQPLPSEVTADFTTHVATCRLMKVEPRYVLYQEIPHDTPATHTQPPGDPQVS